MDRLKTVLPFLEAIETLKGLKRTGWCRAGIPDPESVSDHMYRMVFVCLAHPEIKDDDKMDAVMMCLVHDLGEITAGDITPHDGVAPERKYLEEELGLRYLCGLLAETNPVWAEKIPQIWMSYEMNQDPVAKLVHQVDKFECLSQALIYRKRYRGKFDVNEFKSLRAKITDPWLVKQADQIMEEWEALDRSEGSKTNIIFIIGGPGVGKGTQCGNIIKNYNFEHISVGQLLRDEQDSHGPALSRFIKDSLYNSVIVPPPLTMMLMKSRIQDIQSRGKSVLIDGFPRSIGQAEIFEQEISPTYSTIWLDCSLEAMRERVNFRSQSSNRTDDNAEAMERRLKTFNDSNREVVDYLKSKNFFRKVNASGSNLEVYRDVEAVLKEILEKRKHD